MKNFTYWQPQFTFCLFGFVRASWRPIYIARRDPPIMLSKSIIPTRSFAYIAISASLPLMTQAILIAALLSLSNRRLSSLPPTNPPYEQPQPTNIPLPRTDTARKHDLSKAIVASTLARQTSAAKTQQKPLNPPATVSVALFSAGYSDIQMGSLSVQKCTQGPISLGRISPVYILDPSRIYSSHKVMVNSSIRTASTK